MSTADSIIRKLGLRDHPEGGYILETHRSGSSAVTSGYTDVNVQSSLKLLVTGWIDLNTTGSESYESLTIVPGRQERHPDGDARRNCITSIIWMQTDRHRYMKLAKNLSDNVSYYHCGNAFQFNLYDPTTHTLHRETLGPDFDAGQRLQVVCPRGWWKCGQMLTSDTCDYSLLVEAMGPGFDWHDFSWITEDDIQTIDNKDVRVLLDGFVNI
ncbi:uncharacterized protein LOC128207309 [Mya arenaria]|nr:uncharacterized protein LOC128207309 [Mya arenaria]